MSNLTAAERSELTRLHMKNHHTAQDTARFNELSAKSYSTVRKPVKKRSEAEFQAEYDKSQAELKKSFALIAAKFGGK